LALFLAAWVTPNPARAGVVELSATASYRKTNYDPTTNDAMETGTGSIGYYFWDLSAVELSYTRGAATQATPDYNAYQDFTAYGLDLLITMANQQSMLKPYVKFGAQYQIKNVRYYFPGVPSVNILTQGIAPTGGLGFKLMFTQQLAFKFGFDISTSPLFFYTRTPPMPAGQDDPVTYDVAATAGLSFLF
jgi:hypothetical protein